MSLTVASDTVCPIPLYLVSKIFLYGIQFIPQIVSAMNATTHEEIRSQVCLLNCEIAVLRAELATATKRADIVFLESEIGFLSGQASALAEITEFEP